MSKTAQAKKQPERFLLPAVRNALPRAIRDEYMAQLKEVCALKGDWIPQSVITLVAGYKNQAILAFDKIALALQLGGVAYCFSAAPLPSALCMILGATLGALVFRGAYTYAFDSRGKRRVPTSPWRYSLDSMGDSVTAMVFVLLSQSFAVLFSPGVAMPPSRLFRGIMLALPVLSAMRMILRPRAEWPTPFRDSQMSAQQIYKKAWWLNALWIFTIQSMVVSNPHSLPEWVPEHDFLRTFFPFHVFIVWFRIQQNPLIRRDKIETAFTDWKKKEKARHREILLKGMENGEPFYRWYVILQGILFVYLAIPLAFALSPWLSGNATNGDVFNVVFNLVALITLAWTWNYLKAANRIAADVMQQDIDRPDFYWWPPKPTRWQRLKTWMRSRVVGKARRLKMLVLHRASLYRIAKNTD